MKNIPNIGQRVRTLREFSGIPIGIEGICDEHYTDGCTIAWDLPDRPLPKDWTWDINDMSKWATNQGVPLRDGFHKNELHYLEPIE